MDHVQLNLNTVIALVAGGLITMIGFLIKKWTGSIENKLDLIDDRKVDVKVCEQVQYKMCHELNIMKDLLSEVRQDVKELTKSVSKVPKRGE